MRVKIAMLWLALVGAPGCTDFGMSNFAATTPSQGGNAPAIPSWRNDLVPGEFYVRVSAAAVARTNAQTDVSVCHNNRLQRYFSEDRVVTLFAASGSAANPTNIPVMVFSDRDIDPSTGGAVCQRSFTNQAVTPFVVFPSEVEISTPGLPVNFRLVTVNNSTANVANIFSDISLLLGFVGGGPTSGAVAVIGALSSDATRSNVQRAVDQAAKGQSIIAQTFVVPLSLVQRGPDEAVARIAAMDSVEGTSTPVADLVVRMSVRQSLFEDQMVQTDVRTGRLRFLSGFAAPRILDATLYDPRAPNTAAGERRRVRHIVLDRIGTTPPDGGQALQNYQTAFSQGGPVARTQANQFCDKIRSIFSTDGLALTRRDQNIILWSYVSTENAYRTGTGIFSDPNGRCFDQQDIAQLAAMNLATPTPGPIAETTLQPSPAPFAQREPGMQIALVSGS